MSHGVASTAASGTGGVGELAGSARIARIGRGIDIREGIQGVAVGT